MPELAAPVAEQPTAFEQWSALPEEQQMGQIAEPAKTDPDPDPEAAPKETDESKAAAAAKTAKEAEDYDSLPDWVKKRISGQTKKNRELQAKLEAAAAARPEPVKPAESVAAPAAAEVPGKPEKPNLKDFKNFEEYETANDAYIEKLTKWSAKQLRAEEQANEQQAKVEQSKAASKAAWDADVATATEEFEDFNEVALNHQLPVTQAMFEAILETDNRAKLLYHLGKHPDLAKKIADMPTAAAQVVAIGKLDAKLFPEDGDEPTEKKPAAAATSRAPKPPKPVGGGGGGVDLGKEPDPSDYVAWEKWENRRRKAAEDAA